MSVEITGYGYDGEGVSRVDGKVLFLPYSIKGEVVDFVITEEKSKFLKGRVVNIVKASKHRCQAPCLYYQRCGGCMLQHVEYSHELEIKKELLKAQFNKIGFSGDIQTFTSLREFGYRNKIRMFVGKKGLCLKERASSRLVSIDKCLLCKERINDAIKKINEFIKFQSLQGFFKEVVIREEDGMLLINFVLKKPAKLNYQGLFLLLGANCGIFETFNGVCLSKVGLDKLEVDEMGLKCEFSMNSFHQVNSFLTEKLYQTVLKNIQGDKVLNCYSGAGVLSGVIAKQEKKVFAVELGESEHLDAEKLKKDNNLTNLTNICGDCSEILANFHQKIDTIIVDPPRAGMSEKVCELMDKFKCKQMIYVSCNSSTLIRDISRLNNFEVKEVSLFDMFVKTGEYEVVCVLTHK